MPNPHYQHVLEQDEHLPTPMRWLTRAMSSWWTIGVLGVLVVGYAAAAHVPVGGRYLWQHRLIDATQRQVLAWWPLMAGAWLLAGVILWAALRRLPWRMGSLGRYVCVLGLAIILVSQSWAFRHQTTGVVAVPASDQQDNNKPDPLSLTYTTRYGDTTAREMVLMIGGGAPINVPLTGLPRWSDAAGDEMPAIKIHNDPRLAAMLGFRVRITPVAYIAEGRLITRPDGSQTAEPTPADTRDTTTLPYPAHALLALRFEVEPDQGKAATTTVWLPFEPAATDTLIADRFFQVEGMGTVGLSFRPASRTLPFAVAYATPPRLRQDLTAVIHVADTSEGRLLQPATYAMDLKINSFNYETYDEAGDPEAFTLTLLRRVQQREQDRDQPGYALLSVSRQSGTIYITAGLVTFVLGVVLDFALGWIGPKPKRNPAPKPKANSATA